LRGVLGLLDLLRRRPAAKQPFKQTRGAVEYLAKAPQNPASDAFDRARRTVHDATLVKRCPVKPETAKAHP
jgi:hypothetical protein